MKIWIGATEVANIYFVWRRARGVAERSREVVRRGGLRWQLEIVARDLGGCGSRLDVVAGSGGRELLRWPGHAMSCY